MNWILVAVSPVVKVEPPVLCLVVDVLYTVPGAVKYEWVEPSIYPLSEDNLDYDRKCYDDNLLLCDGDNKFLSLRISNASVSKEFPARTAVDSPNFLWVESFPLLIESLSIQGKSSWIKE